MHIIVLKMENVLIVINIMLCSDKFLCPIHKYHINNMMRKQSKWFSNLLAFEKISLKIKEIELKHSLMDSQEEIIIQLFLFGGRSLLLYHYYHIFGYYEKYYYMIYDAY